jgi:hypothetical protein
LKQRFLLKERALETFKMRNELKMQARSFMEDRVEEAKLPAPRTLADVLKRARDSGAQGDEVWFYLLADLGEPSPSPSVDKALGLMKPADLGL